MQMTIRHTTDTRTDQGWTGVVLAGGRSTRMGRDKALLDWQGQTLLEHMQAQLRAAGARRVVVSGDYPQAGGVPDRAADLGPLGGLASIAEVLADGVVLLVPVDMPRLGVALLRELMQVDAPCACFIDHILPLRLHLDAPLRDWLRQAAAMPPAQRSLRALHRHLQGVHLPLPAGAAAQLANCNTPAQWQELAQ